MHELRLYWNEDPGCLMRVPMFTQEVLQCGYLWMIRIILGLAKETNLSG